MLQAWNEGKASKQWNEWNEWNGMKPRQKGVIEMKWNPEQQTAMIAELRKLCWNKAKVWFNFKNSWNE